MSGGQQQRVSLARALMNGGRVILADEPTGALDSVSGREVIGLLQELNAEGHMIVVIMHDPEVAAQARRCIRIGDGLIVSDEQQEGAGPAAAPQPHASEAAAKSRSRANLGETFFCEWL